MDSLPLELLECVFKYLRREDKFNASTVCQAWHKAALRSVTRLFCYDERCWIGRHGTYCERYDLKHDLDNLKKFYEERLNQSINWWDILAHFPKLNHLEVIVRDLEEGILNAISTHVTELEYLFLSHEIPPEGYNWKRMGSQLTILTSLKVEFHHEGGTKGDFHLMLPFCQNLRKIDIGLADVTNTWNGIIPKRVTHARFLRCCVDRTNIEGSLFSFIFEDPTTIKRLFWEESDQWCQLSDVDVVPLTNVTHLHLDTESSLEYAVFEHCKVVEKLFIRRCDAKQFSRVKHLLPHIRKFQCLRFCGTLKDIEAVSPKVQECYLDPCESCDELSE